MNYVLKVLFMIAIVFTVWNITAQSEETLQCKVTEVLEGDIFVAQTVEDNPRTIKLRIWGIDAPEEGQHYFEEAKKFLTELISDKNVKIELLTTDNLNEEVKAGADIALYGHTHHGQAFPGNIATQIVFEVAHGYKKKGNTHVYVTSGIGLVGPQYRIGTVSEMVMMTVKF